MTKKEDDPFDRLNNAVKRQDLEEKGAKALSAARIRLVLGRDAKTVFFATLALKLVAKPSWEIETGCTDGKHLWYNPEWLLSQKDEQRVGFVAHEVMHDALGHQARKQHRELKRYNVAADLSINPLLREAGFDLPDDAVFPGEGKYQDLPRGLSMEEYYTLLEPPKKEEEPEPGDEPGQGGGGGGQGDGEGEGEPQPGEGEGQGGGGGCPDPGGCGAVMPAGDGSPAAARESQAEWEVALAQAHAVAKQRGTLPACIDRLVQEVLAPKVDWREVLRQFVSSHARNDFRWFPPNKRFIHQGIYLPGMRSEELGSIVLAVDTSGSIGQEELNAFAGEIQGILEAYSDVELTILYADAAIQHVQTWRSSDGPLRLEPKGGGGTSHDPVFQHVEEHLPDATCVICFTDAYTSLTVPEPEVPVLWAVIQNDSPRLPWGQVLPVKL